MKKNNQSIILTLILALTIQTASAQKSKVSVAEENKKMVVEFYQKLFGDNDISIIDQYIAEDYIQHNPYVADGRKALKDALTQWLANAPKKKIDFQRVAADGDLVFLHIKSEGQGGKKVSLVDIFKVQNGKIVEHWDVMQEVPEKAANEHPMF
ncbi:MAG: hypothetical protein JWQ25_1 [Daejeonella sp.]|nr:hypothetical protein [Daejeonella sp.]